MHFKRYQINLVVSLTTSEFYTRSIKSWQEGNNLEIFSTHNEEKSVVSEKFNRCLKSKIYNYVTTMSKNMYVKKLDGIVNKYRK